MPEAVTDDSQSSAGVSPPESGNATPPGGGNAGSEPSDADRNWKALRQDRDSLQDRVMDLEARLNANATKPTATTQAAEEPTTRKTLADFKWDEAAYEEYLEERLSKSARKAARDELDADNAKREKADRQSTFESRAAEFAKTNPTYDATVKNPRFTQSDHLIGEILGSKMGPQIALYLASNLDETNAINRMAAVGAARAVAKIEAKLEANAKAAGAGTAGGATANQLPGAANGNAAQALPDPPPKIDGAGDPGIKKDPVKMSDGQWYKDREERRRKR